MKKLIILFLVLGSFLIFFTTHASSASLAWLKGYILLQVQQHGESWYVNPTDFTRYYMKNGPTAYEMMRSFGLGITDADLAKIPKDSDTFTGDLALRTRLSGRILLQVQQNGEAWYVYPKNKKRYYLKDGAAAFEIMRSLGLGITDADLAKLTSRDLSSTPSSNSNVKFSEEPVFAAPENFAIDYQADYLIEYSIEQDVKRIKVYYPDIAVAKLTLSDFDPLIKQKAQEGSSGRYFNTKDDLTSLEQKQELTLKDLQVLNNEVSYLNQRLEGESMIFSNPTDPLSANSDLPAQIALGIDKRNNQKVEVSYFCSDVCPQYGFYGIYYKDLTAANCTASGGQIKNDPAWGGYIGCEVENIPAPIQKTLTASTFIVFDVSEVSLKNLQKQIYNNKELLNEIQQAKISNLFVGRDDRNDEDVYIQRFVCDAQYDKINPHNNWQYYDVPENGSWLSGRPWLYYNDASICGPTSYFVELLYDKFGYVPQPAKDLQRCEDDKYSRVVNHPQWGSLGCGLDYDYTNP